MKDEAARATAWVYRGVWGALVRYLRVPEEKPNHPPGSGELVRGVKPSHGFLRYLKLWFWLAAIAIDIALIGGWLAITVGLPPLGIVLAPIVWALAILPDIVAYAAIHVRYDSTWYIVTERAVRIRRGVWVIRENTITLENVQNVEVTQGPVQRYFGISNLVVKTAGGGGSVATPHGEVSAGSHHGLIEGIEDAQGLRDLIMERVRASRGAGLGDDLAHAAAPGRMDERHLSALRSIRDALVRPCGSSGSAS